MRFTILLSAAVIADAIEPEYKPSKMALALVAVFTAVFLYADAIEFYKKVWKR